eukprot:475590_1
MINQLMIMLKNDNPVRLSVISKWNNNDIIEWVKTIKNMNLESQWNDIKVLNIIQSNECARVGEDIVELESVDDIGEAFEISDNKILCKRLYKEIGNFKPVLKGGNQLFKINMYYNNDHITLNEEVLKTDTIKKIK